MGHELKTAGRVLLVLVVALVAWGFVEPYTLDLEEEVAVVPNLPPVWEGERFAQIADFQLGLWGDNDPTIRRAVARVIEERPAFVLLSGDFVYGIESVPAEEITHAADLVRPLVEAGIPTYAVLGNHDYGMSEPQGHANLTIAARVRDALEEVGVTVLFNESVVLPTPEPPVGEGPIVDPQQPVYLVGIGPYYPDLSRPEEALRGVPDHAPRVVMMHNPESFKSIPANAAPTAVAGHTHGGQINVPGLPFWSWMDLVEKDEVHADGWVEDEYGQPGNRLYVNRGIGMSVVPIRLFCRPELTLFTLVSAERGDSATL